MVEEILGKKRKYMEVSQVGLQFLPKVSKCASFKENSKNLKWEFHQLLVSLGEVGLRNFTKEWSPAPRESLIVFKETTTN